ncbi:MAG: FmdB family zinc ribbon protein [Deltaproteobacteria bacterium]
MPIFEYACPKCGKNFEKLVLNRKQSLPACPECGWKKVKEKFSTFASAGTSAKSARGACAPSGGG